MSEGHSRAPVLLTMADYYGTLAAVRSLGRAGIGVSVAESRLLVPARWSRHVRQVHACPDPEAAPSAFAAWLVDLGRRSPGQVLLPTSDGIAWILAVHREALAPHFVVDSPPPETVYALLNKWRLQELCRSVGLETPWTALPADDAELEALAREIRYPVMVKPQTQVGLWPHQKGRVVEDGRTLVALYGDLQRATRVQPELLALDPLAARPLLQAFSTSAADGIYTVSGFSDARHDVFLAQASRKILQRPRRLGVGLCFEEADLDPSVAGGIERLCRKLGYRGVFEVEFVQEGGRHLLIDFNPRFFGEMAFDVDRGLDLPMLAYLAAVGDRSGLEAVLPEARRAVASRGDRVFCSGVQMSTQFLVQLLAGGGRPDERAHWRGWLRAHRGRVTHPSLDRSDPVPWLVDAAREVTAMLAHPRAAWRAARRG
ncbi:MAG TPA: carbamoyl-phosphate synthase [Anaeromyxobacteraceae bacterium]|nr:carbamoyl-phosphate synthase [Anaeromyxobacteraceae bacterium]